MQKYKKHVLLNSFFLFTGTDLSLRPPAPPPHTFRYSSQPTQPQSQQQSPAPPVPGQYSRSMHQMHCPTYPPSYYAYSQDMCYSPPYQPPYYPPKVYPSPYRRYMPAATYYSPQPNEMYETTGPQGPSVQAQTSGSLQPQSTPLPPPSGQLIPSGANMPQHLEHYAPYYSSYNPGGGQCYTRSIQPPYMGKQMYDLVFIHIHSLNCGFRCGLCYFKILIFYIFFLHSMFMY